MAARVAITAWQARGTSNEDDLFGAHADAIDTAFGARVTGAEYGNYMGGRGDRTSALTFFLDGHAMSIEQYSMYSNKLELKGCGQARVTSCKF